MRIQVLISLLPEGFQNDLTHKNTPIGKLWSKYRTETYKSAPVIQREKPSKELAIDLDISPNGDILSRTYSVYYRGRIVMVITEKFSADGLRVCN